jgi:chemotaxis protein MotB
MGLMVLGKKKKKNGVPGAPAWMTTYSDMVTLLLTFFVLLLSMAEMDKVKFDQAVGSLRGAFGIVQGTPNQDPKSNVIIPRFDSIPYDMLQRVYKQVLMNIEKLELDRDIEVAMDRGAMVLRVTEKILFDPGSTSLKNEAGPVLLKVAELVLPLPFEIRIEGHSDNTPYIEPGQTNWDLSAQRAIAVLKYFAEGKLLPLDRLSAVGYGDQRPLVPNDSIKNRSLNRRVEFVLEFGGDYREALPYLIDSSAQLPF